MPKNGASRNAWVIFDFKCWVLSPMSGVPPPLSEA